MAEQAALPQAVRRALTQSLGSIQRQLGEVQSSFEEVKSALESGSPSSTVELLPPLMHMQAAGAALAASIESVLRFVGASSQWTGIPAMTMPAAPAPAPVRAATPAPVAEAPAPEPEPEPVPVEEAPPPAAGAVDVDSLSDELKALHKKAKRFAKVTVQELSMYKKDEVAKGREHKDLYRRFKEEIDKSKALYDERFQKIADHNIDYLYDELVRVLAENDPSALGDYPYAPSRS